MLGFAYMIAGALYALGFASNFVEFVHIYWAGLPHGPTWTVLYALAVVGLLVLLNALSTAASGGAETTVTIVKIVILLIFAAFGAAAVDLGNFQPFVAENKTALSILPAMGLTFIAFEGYDLITTVTEEVENPRENIPKAIFISLVATVLIYLLVVFVAIGTIGAERLGEAGETGIAAAAEGFMPPIPLLGDGAALIVFGAVFSTLSALNAVVLASSRVVFAMGRENQLPDPIGQISAQYGTPITSVLICGGIMLASATLLPIRQVGRVSSFFFLISFVVVNYSVIRLRRERPNMRPLRDAALPGGARAGDRPQSAAFVLPPARRSADPRHRPRLDGRRWAYLRRPSVATVGPPRRSLRRGRRSPPRRGRGPVLTSFFATPLTDPTFCP
jgi:amino acid transporter